MMEDGWMDSWMLSRKVARWLGKQMIDGDGWMNKWTEEWVSR